MGTDVLVRALLSYNTKWFRKYIAPTIELEIRQSVYTTPSLITIWFGTNDAALTNGTASKTHVPIEDYKENLVALVHMFSTAAPTATLLLITPPHSNDAVRAKLAPEEKENGTIDRTNAMTMQYARACVEAGAELGVPVLDLNTYFNKMPETTRNGYLLADGLHLNALGNKLVYEQLQSKIAEVPNLKETLEAQRFPLASKYEEEDPFTGGNDSS